ncbi:MAG: efflux RND transporter periplasmic adaptor subunit [Rubrivivax sp.]|nr:efflux RND transporter periplasmic adaptor subunit [Rubrivivax sp.]
MNDTNASEAREVGVAARAGSGSAAPAAAAAATTAPAPAEAAAAAIAPTPRHGAAALDDLLGVGAGRRPLWHRPAAWAGVALLAAAAGFTWWWLGQRQAAAAPRYVTQPATRGALTVTVTANGTLQPTQLVAVGSELSGTVARVLVDVNARVKRGQLLAELDTARLSDQVKRSRAGVAAAEAQVQQARATLAETRATLERLEDVARRSGGEVPSRQELDTARAAVARAQAAEASALAAVAESAAALSSDETNLRKASIRAPIDGVVLARNVDPGNAVAASLQAVTLFSLAEDLAKMTLQVNVDEADVGRVQEGQKATFTVSAHPNRRYPATISRLRYGSTTKDNVVTYLADLDVPNADLSLRPGMTATATITTVERADALLVPNAALRFNPEAAAGAAASSNSGGGIVGALMPRPPRGTNVPKRAGTDTSRVRQVWVLQDGRAVAVPVTPGVSDGRVTEVTSEQLRPGMPVIVDQASAAR